MSQFVFTTDNHQQILSSGQFIAKAPSNIALIKYWGKYGIQLPKNPSLSFTLSECLTETRLTYTPRQDKTSAFDFEIYFEGQKAPDFKPKIETFFNRIATYSPFIKDYQLQIHTSNTFPHSSGIASSASGMAALALCIMQMEKALNPQLTDAYFYQKASFLARLGSGSAARSIVGPIMIWGKHSEIQGSSNDFAIANPFNVHPVFENYQDTVLIVDKGQKQVSSTLGHSLMNDHPYAQSRFEQAHRNIMELIEILKTGDLPGFIRLVESEALTLHAMMMTGQPYFILMQPNTLKIIEAIWDYRKNHSSSVCFTLDAGANVHVLYPEKEKENTLLFIENKLSSYCENGQYICDYTGSGSALF